MALARCSLVPVSALRDDGRADEPAAAPEDWRPHRRTRRARRTTAPTVHGAPRGSQRTPARAPRRTTAPTMQGAPRELSARRRGRGGRSSAVPSCPEAGQAVRQRGLKYFPLREALVPRALASGLKDVPLLESLTPHGPRLLRLPCSCTTGADTPGTQRTTTSVPRNPVSRPVVALVLVRQCASVASRAFRYGKLSFLELSSLASKTFHYGKF